MKKILVSMFAVAALAACSNEHTVVVAPQNDAIDFTTHVDKATRVATDITKDNIDNFGVYASVTNSQDASALILTNEEVTKNGGAWVYGNTQYWVPGNSYNFVAIAPYQNGSSAKWTYTPGNLAQNGDIAFDNGAAAGEMDLVYAYAQRNNVAQGDMDAVGLTFNHLLSKVAFKFTNGFAATNNITFNVYDLKVNNAVDDATVSVANGVVGNWVAASTFERAFTNACPVLEATDKYTTEHYYFVPVAKEYNITFSIDVYQSGVKVATYNHGITTTINFEKGGNYSINATFTPENINPNAALDKIDFEVVKVDGWDENVTMLKATTVATAAELAAAVAKGGDICLTQDIALAGEELNVAAGNEVNVDLNGCTLTINGAATTPATGIDPISNYGKMTISNGKIVSANAEVYRRCIFNQEGGEMVINNVEFVQQYDKAGAAINNKGKMTINNATVDAVRYAVWSSGTNAETIINSGTFSNETDKNLPVYAVVAYDGAKMTINGGTFISDHGCVCACGGSQVLINGGTFTCTSEYNAGSDWVFAGGDGSNPMNNDGSRINYDESECVINGNIFNNGCVVAF